MLVIPSEARNLRFLPLGRNKDFSVALLLRNDKVPFSFAINLKLYLKMELGNFLT